MGSLAVSAVDGCLLFGRGGCREGEREGCRDGCLLWMSAVRTRMEEGEGEAKEGWVYWRYLLLWMAAVHMRMEGQREEGRDSLAVSAVDVCCSHGGGLRERGRGVRWPHIMPWMAAFVGTDDGRGYAGGGHVCCTCSASMYAVLLCSGCVCLVCGGYMMEGSRARQGMPHSLCLLWEEMQCWWEYHTDGRLIIMIAIIIIIRELLEQAMVA